VSILSSNLSTLSPLEVMVIFNDTVVIPQGYCTFVVSLAEAGNQMNILVFQSLNRGGREALAYHRRSIHVRLRHCLVPAASVT